MWTLSFDVFLTEELEEQLCPTDNARVRSNVCAGHSIDDEFQVRVHDGDGREAVARESFHIVFANVALAQ